MKKLIIILIVLLIFNSVAGGENKVKVKFFFGEGCEHCKIAEGYFDDLKKEYGETLDIEMIDVFTPEGYKEFKSYGFVMTPGIVFNEQVKIEGEPAEEELRNVIESFLNPKKVIVRFFYNEDKKDEEYERISNILSGIHNKDVGVLYLDYDKNRNDFLYFGFSRVPSVSINEISFESNINKELIYSVINFYLEGRDIKILGFYSDEKEKEIVNNIINSKRYADKTSILWLNVNKNSKEFYLDGFSETPSVVINDKIKIQNVTRVNMIKGLESFDPKFYSFINVYFIAYFYLKYITIGIIGIMCIALYRVFL